VRRAGEAVEQDHAHSQGDGILRGSPTDSAEFPPPHRSIASSRDPRVIRNPGPGVQISQPFRRVVTRGATISTWQSGCPSCAPGKSLGRRPA